MNKKKIYIKTAQKAILVGTIFAIIFSMCGFYTDCEDISNSVLRLHILANSDDQADQDLKLKVRDAVVDYSKDIFGNADTLDTAENIAQDNLEQIKQVAEQTIRENGYNYDAKVELTNMYFDTRTYNTVTLPAGYYDALRITIGEGKGHNWWCVLFPPMCVSSACEDDELSDVLNDDEMNIVTNADEYKIKFKSVEIIENLKQHF